MRLGLPLLALAAVAVAVAVSIVLSPSYHHLLLRIPHVGFVLFGLTGGSIPPYFVKDAYTPAAVSKWRSDRDVFVATPAKSGTTWTLYLLHQIRSRGASPDTFDDLQMEIGWGEFVYYPGQPLAERIDRLQRQAKQKLPFAIFKTHFAPQDLGGYDNNTKYVVTVRSVVDAAASFYPFLRNHKAGFAKMWGGFPPTAGQAEQPGEMLEYEQSFLADMGAGKAMIDVLLLDVIAGFWPLRHQPNVHFMHYAQLVKSPKQEVERLARFLNIELTEEEVANVVLHTSFAEMKKHSAKFDGQRVFDEYRGPGQAPGYVDGFVSGLVRSGGGGKEQLRPEFAQAILARTQARLGKEAADWVESGGEGALPT